MSAQLIWFIVGVICIFLEIIIPGGIVVFLGVSAVIVAALIYFGVITSVVSAFLSWFILSIFMMFVLRSFVMKYFEGDSHRQNVDEDEDAKGAMVEVIEEILPHKEGRVRFRETTWVARSDEALVVGVSAIIEKRDGNKWIVKSIS